MENDKKYILVNGNKIEWQKDMNITKILKVMNYTFKMIVVKVNGKVIPKEDYDNFFVDENADVKVIHLISGG
jgi:thiamine biosynthesis protein ThiS